MDDDLRRDLIDWWTSTKYLYARILSMRSGKETWQNARFILPSGMEWRFSWTMNTRALWDSVMPQRLHFCEQYDTVGVAWKMWLAIWDKFPLIAAHLRPGCDWAHKCVYADQYKLSELFGCLFKSCGRYKVDDSLYATFNESSTSIEEMEELLHMKIPRPDDWGKLVDVALAKDWKYFK
jgi:thymidylate synthase ThyX